MNLKCFFGFHDWKDDSRFEKDSGREICERCKKERLVIYGIMYEDYLKLPEHIKEKHKDQFVF